MSILLDLYAFYFQKETPAKIKPYIDAKSDAKPANPCIKACVKYNFVGIENPRLYSETYLGTKTLVQRFIDRLEEALTYLLQQSTLSDAEKYSLCRYLNANFGRTALCLSGGTSKYIHFSGKMLF